jgi:hypothetical protein
MGLTLSSPKPVRTRGYFGQLFSFPPETCPNSELLQTAFLLLPLNLSEHEATSDSFSPSSPKPVRTPRYFGQLFSFPPETCPNSELLQTAFLLLPLNLSEHEATSDSFSPSSPKPVRTPRYFGQLFSFPPETCPNSDTKRKPSRNGQGWLEKLL